MMESKVVHEKVYEILSLLGHGKGGYSYLARSEGSLFVLKQIHHEPCDYYHFGNKIEAEKNDYARLLKTGIRMPKMIDVDEEQEIVIKEYVKGDTIAAMIEKGEDVSSFLPQVEYMASRCKARGLNIDYYPTNFVAHEGKLYYVDYECNEYMDEWSFDTWGVKHWVKP